MKTIVLNDGRKLPAIGLGTWKSTEEGEAYQAVRKALDIGYRHIDCAHIYGNEAEIGRAISDSISDGICSRDDLWITSKLWNNSHESERVLEACKFTLEQLNLDYLDLYLMHWPIAFRSDVMAPENANGFLSLEDVPLSETWGALLSLQEKGLSRSVGVSNFSARRLQEIIDSSGCAPAVNQVELHPFLPQRELFDFCQKQNIHLTAYSPLGSNDRPDVLKRPDEKPILDNDTIAAIANEHQTTPARVLIAWAVQRGTSVIPKSTNAERLAENLSASQLVLTETNMKQISQLETGLRYVNPVMWFGEESPYNEKDQWD
ncbi:MAG: aldo/keto reductase [Pseudobacteriovorax sp.]|nr:aldo/keto reductase [Pseudobacteriovorax sp.]